MLQITCSYLTHKNTDCILLKSDFSSQLNTIYKNLPFATYSNTNKSWYIAKDKEQLKQIAMVTKTIAQLNVESLKATPIKTIIDKEKIVKLPIIVDEIVEANAIVSNQNISIYNHKQLLLMLQNLTLKAYSPSTVRTYKNEFTIFLQTIKKTNADEFTPQRIKDYLQYCFNTLRLSESTVHSRMNALKFYYEQVLQRTKFFWTIPAPKKPFLLPRFFNQDEIASIINATANLKHKAMLTISYSCGLRVSEVVALKTVNIDSNRMCILIQSAKGKKDRMVSLSPVLLIILREYARVYKLDKKGYLFEGQVEGTKYGIRSLQFVIDAAKKKANILKPGSIHALRHSFATHLVDKGTDVTMIQKLLGHNDIKTTMRYLHTSNKDLLRIISPLDDLKINLK